ncbi:hypothetical protein BDZ91DRAFT_491012 [Kalaharituber pfeilii]|nr:hypothetical protein BDZ91DRAFT_491012 [Kalaharituber pfeilii]
MSDIDDHNNSNPHSPASEMSQTLSAHSAEIQWGHPDDQVVAAWWLFVNENWVPRTTEMQQEEQATEYEYVQRRRLIKEWVEKAQDERDAYAERASALSEDEVVGF